MDNPLNQTSHPSSAADHHLARRGDPNFSTSQPYSSTTHSPPTYGNALHAGAHPQQIQSRGYEDVNRGLQHVSPNQSRQYPQQRQAAAGYSNREALQLPQMDNDLSGLTRDLQAVRVSSSPQPTHAASPISHHSSPGHSIPRKPIHGESDFPARDSSREHRPFSNHPLPVPPYTASDPNSSAASKRALPDLTGIVDLRNTADTDVYEHVAPAVVHETRHREIRRIREEKITREIHTHDVFHRIQPIIDVEVLPARHFVPAADGSLREVAEETLPGRVREKVRSWIVAETVSRIPSSTPVDSLRARPRQFTARSFTGTEGDFRRYVGADGVEHTETTWVHPPVLEEGARLTGQTVPIALEGEGVSRGSKSRSRESHVHGLHDRSSHNRGISGFDRRGHDSHSHRALEDSHGAHEHRHRALEPSHGAHEHSHEAHEYRHRAHEQSHGAHEYSHGVHEHRAYGHGLHE